jgi:hypothetical protein
VELELSGRATGAIDTNGTDDWRGVSSGDQTALHEPCGERVAVDALGEGVERIGLNQPVSLLEWSLSGDDVESFCALGVEVCLVDCDGAEFWLVPQNTALPRRELAVKDLRLITEARRLFPGVVLSWHWGEEFIPN